MPYLLPIYSAILLFPVLALLLTIPVALHHYHQFGAITLARELIVFSFFFYLLAVYFLVILPLPDINAVTRQGIAGYYQPVPFGNLMEYYAKYGLSFTRTSMLHFLKSSTLRQLGFNVLMTFPFGCYLRYYFRCGWVKTLLFSFLLSLFFELTQLSGLYGIYSGPYRLFDADDLMCNTLGSMLGFWLSPLFSSHLPDRRMLDTMARHKSEKVTLFRRVCALLVDVLLAAATYLVVGAALAPTTISQALLDASFYGFLTWLLLFIWLCTLLTKGRSAGKMWCHLRVEDTKGRPAPWWRLTLRYLVLWVQLVASQIASDLLMTAYRGASGNAATALHLVALACEAVFYLFLIEGLAKLLKGSTPFLYERLSGTRSQSIFLEECAEAQTDAAQIEPMAFLPDEHLPTRWRPQDEDEYEGEVEDIAEPETEPETEYEAEAINEPETPQYPQTAALAQEPWQGEAPQARPAAQAGEDETASRPTATV